MALSASDSRARVGVLKHSTEHVTPDPVCHLCVRGLSCKVPFALHTPIIPTIAATMTSGLSSPPECHPLFAPTPTQTHPLPELEWGEVPSPYYPPGDYVPIRSGFAAFGDYDDEDGDEEEFELFLPIYGKIARRRARRKGVPAREMYKEQWHQMHHERELKKGVLAHVDTSFNPIHWDAVPGGFYGDHKYAFEEVSPRSLFPAMYSDARRSVENPGTHSNGTSEKRTVRKAKAEALKKITAATTRRTRLAKQNQKQQTKSCRNRRFRAWLICLLQ